MKELEWLQNLTEPYTPISLATQTRYRALCLFRCNKRSYLFSYLKTVCMTGDSHVGFVVGKSKLAPRPPHTVPCLELVLCSCLGSSNGKLHLVKLYTDSKTRLGYIHKTSQQFYVYICNRITWIRNSSHPHQCVNYIQHTSKRLFFGIFWIVTVKRQTGSRGERESGMTCNKCCQLEPNDGDHVHMWHVL